MRRVHYQCIVSNNSAIDKFIIATRRSKTSAIDRLIEPLVRRPEEYEAHIALRLSDDLFFDNNIPRPKSMAADDEDKEDTETMDSFPPSFNLHLPLIA